MEEQKALCGDTVMMSLCGVSKKTSESQQGVGSALEVGEREAPIDNDKAE